MTTNLNCIKIKVKTNAIAKTMPTSKTSFNALHLHDISHNTNLTIEILKSNAIFCNTC